VWQIIICLSDDDWALSGQVVYASTMGTFMMGVIPVGDKGGGAHKGLVVYVAAVNAGVEGLEGASETWSRYQCSPALRSGSGDMQLVAAEPDLKCSQPSDPDLIAHAHLAGAEPNDMPIEGKDDWLKVEGEETAVNATVEEDADPCANLQGNRVSHLTMPKEDIFLTFPSSPLHTTLEAARMQRSPPVDTGTPAIEEPELSGYANMALLLLDTPLPEC